MSKAKPGLEQPLELSEDAITVEEFCTRLSQNDRRVELIGAFHFDEKRSGRIKDSESAFAERFDKFATTPA